MNNTLFGPPLPGRRCGDCTLCCTLVPVKELRKPANKRCQHQGLHGCRIYAKRPLGCMAWNCAWLIDPSTVGLRRPDRCRYVIDAVPDRIHVTNNATGKVDIVVVVQVWIDPKHADAYQDPALYEWLEKHDHVALLRFGNDRARVIFPPGRMKNNEWYEQDSSLALPESSLWAELSGQT